MQFSLCLLSSLSSAPLPETLPDDIGPAALWEALGSDPAALRAVHTVDTRAHTHTEQPQELVSVPDVQSHRELGGMSLSWRDLSRQQNKGC